MDTLFSIAPGDVTVEHLDVLKCILDILPFSSLMSLTGVNRVLRALILKMFNRRTAYFISLFVPDGFTLQFFKLLHSTQACIVGSVVRCIITNEMYDHFKNVNPLQLNIVVPNTPTQADAASQRFRKWKRFLHSCGYSGITEPYELSYNLRASCSQWYWTKLNSDGDRKVSLVESKTSSVYQPVFQTSQTSNFFLMSSTRIYSLYPRLHDLSFNLSLRSKSYTDPFGHFNYGLLSFRSSEEWEAFSRTCGEACPSIRRFTEDFPGWRVFRWGGHDQSTDQGNVVSPPDPYTGFRSSWRLSGECSKQRCRNFHTSVDLFDAAV